MQRAINTRLSHPQLDLIEAARHCAEIGFEAVELTVEPSGPLTPAADEKTCRRLHQDLRDVGLGATSLTGGPGPAPSLGAPDEDERERARAGILAMLDRAMWLGARAIVVEPGFVGGWNAAKPRSRYADTLYQTYESLRGLTFEAEARGVSIALRNVNLLGRFLLSPVETAELIDRVNSPWVGVCLDTGLALSTGYPEDWVSSLGPRIVRVRVSDYDLSRGGPDAICDPCDGDVDWPAVMQALADVGYDGALIYDGAGDPADIKQRLDRLMAMRSGA